MDFFNQSMKETTEVSPLLGTISRTFVVKQKPHDVKAATSQVTATTLQEWQYKH